LQGFSASDEIVIPDDGGIWQKNVEERIARFVVNGITKMTAYWSTIKTGNHCH
jgi:hypothetical protein